MKEVPKEQASTAMEERTQQAKKAGLKGLAIACCYGATSTGMAFANKTILSYFEYDYPLFIIASQMLFTILVLEVLRHLKVIELHAFSVSAGVEFFVPSLLYAVNSVMSLSALSGMNIPIYGAIKRCTPIVILLMSTFVLKSNAPSRTILMSVIMITGGCLLASYGDLQFDLTSYIYGFISVCAQALYLLLVQKASTHRSALETLHLNSYDTFPILAAICILTGEGSQAIENFPLTDSLFLLILLIVISMGCFLNFMLFWCTTYNSALTTSVTGALKSIVTTAVGSFTFGGISHNIATFVGISLNLSGGLLYSLSKYLENKHKALAKQKSSVNMQKEGKYENNNGSALQK